MTIAPICSIPYRPLLQAAFAPVKLIYGIFLKAIGYLLLFLGAKDWGEYFKLRGERIDSQCVGLFVGLYAYGRRFLVIGENSQSCCRGSCYWVISEHFSSPDKPLEEIAMTFEEGAPLQAVEMHKKNQIPRNVAERRVWEVIDIRKWPPIPKLDPGVYLFLVGYSKNVNDHGKAHLFTLFKGEHSKLFDPNTGLSDWEDGDWIPLLERIGSSIRSSEGGYFTIQSDLCTKL